MVAVKQSVLWVSDVLSLGSIAILFDLSGMIVLAYISQDTSMMLVMELMEEDLFHAIANDATGSGDSVLWNFRYILCSLQASCARLTASDLLHQHKAGCHQTWSTSLLFDLLCYS